MSLSISSQVDRLKDALVSAASSEALCMLIQSLDDNDFTVEDTSATNFPDGAKIFEALSHKQKQVSEYADKVAVLQEKINATRQRVLQKLKDAGWNEDDVPLSHKELRNRLDFKVNHLTSLMVSKREFLEEAKRRRDVEKEELAVSQQESSITANAHQPSAPEENINTLIDEWMNSRLGQLSLRDNTHVVLDTSKSSILKDIPLSLEGGTRFRCLLKQPRDCEAAFGVENLHPLGGSMEAMKIAQAATQAMTPSIAVNHAIWEQFSETIK